MAWPPDSFAHAKPVPVSEIAQRSPKIRFPFPLGKGLGVGLFAHPRCSRITLLRHTDDPSNASGRTWLLASGQLRAREAGSGF